MDRLVKDYGDIKKDRLLLIKDGKGTKKENGRRAGILKGVNG